MKIAFLKQGEETGTRRHIFALANCFREKGVEVMELDLSEGDLQDRVRELLDFSPLFVVDLDGSCLIFGEGDGQKVPIFDAFGFVQVSFFTEDPLLNFSPLVDIKGSNNFLPVVMDLKYTESLRFLGHERGTFYITPFIEPRAMPQTPKEKDIEVVFVGPVVDPNLLANSLAQNMDKNLLPYFFEVGEFLFRNPEAHILYTSEYILSLFNPGFQEEFSRWRQENPQEYMRLLRDISSYATARKRWYLLNFLEGINLKVLGAYEGELKDSHEHIETESWEEALRVIGRSYLTILSYPHAIPTGLGFLPLEVAYMESAVFIDYRATLPSFFSPESEIITYLPLDRADIEEKLLYYLENLQEAKEIGHRAKEKVLQSHTPKDRCEFLYNLFQDILSQAQQSNKA
ncbi:MAG: glycosyltransferase [Aquificaceae bacterium]